MKKFKFSLESLLTLREWEEQRAQQGLAEANAQIDRIQSRLQRLNQSIDRAYQTWNGSEKRSFSPMERLGLSSSVEDLRREVEETSKALQEAATRRTRALEALVDAARNRKVVTNLKSTRLRSYREDVQRQEAIEIEDIFNARRSAQ